THGDWHLGQLVCRDRWLLIDVDDLGVGDPAWDLARPAAWYAAGLLEPAVWERFLGAYLASGGPALGQGDDPWQRLDLPARALTVQLAAVAVLNAEREKRELDEVEHALIESCSRIVRA
ncbi:phosphotransferase, partial [Nonomuraea sp. NPDC001684]